MDYRFAKIIAKRSFIICYGLSLLVMILVFGLLSKTSLPTFVWKSADQSKNSMFTFANLSVKENEFSYVVNHGALLYCRSYTDLQSSDLLSIMAFTIIGYWSIGVAFMSLPCYIWYANRKSHKVSLLERKKYSQKELEDLMDARIQTYLANRKVRSKSSEVQDALFD